MSKYQIKHSGYRIRHLAELTGFSRHVLRKWEQRFNLLSPQRGDNGYRVFDQTDLQILLFVRSKLADGSTIGQLAARGRAALIAEMNSGAIDISEVPKEYKHLAEKIVSAARSRDSVTIEKTLDTLIQQLGFEPALTKIFFPLLRFIGDLWHQGRISVLGEQSVSQPIHRLLAEYNRLQNGGGVSQAIVACAPDDFHEIGAMAVSLFLRKNGWDVTYLGPNSNIDMMRLACERHRAKLVIVSCTVERPLTHMKHLTEKIMRQLMPITTVLIGGKGANLHIDSLKRKGIRYIEKIEQFNELIPQSQIFSKIT